MTAYKAPKGTKDVLPEQSYQWQFLESRIREIVKKYGFLEARTPVFEHTELFLRGVGETTDIVQKEMYTFQDKGERSMTLKPEGTAGVVRMFVENNLFGETQPTKMYYLYNPVFRYERPQAGRLREHHQFGDSGHQRRHSRGEGRVRSRPVAVGHRRRRWRLDGLRRELLLH